MTNYVILKDRYVTDKEIEFVTNILTGEFEIIDILDSKTYDKFKAKNNIDRKIILLSLGNDYDINKEILGFSENRPDSLINDAYDKYVLKVYKRLFDIGYGVGNSLNIGIKNGAEFFASLGRHSVLKNLIPYSKSNDIKIQIGTISNSFSEIVKYNTSFLPISDRRSIERGADKLEIIGWGSNFNFKHYEDEYGKDALKKLSSKFVEPFIYYTRLNNTISFLIDIESSFSSEFIEYFKHILNNKPFKK